VTEVGIPQREHFDEKIDALEKHISGRFTDLERHLSTKIEAVGTASAIANEVARQAVTKAEVAVERRLEGLNELRSLVGDYQRTLLPRAEADNRFSNIEAKIDKLEKSVDDRTAHAGGLAAGWAYLIAAAGLAAVVVGIVVGIRG